ncbi:Cadherin-related family member 4 [Gossypium australe]|uniref:Cadherin-related family member 4 n=1 Tax=Gossypium australe TaxID=47621 RepID=A0A5B6VJS3_9ROSI|nr:Cadherin-related family member 4 [Gossypium australe]
MVSLERDRCKRFCFGLHRDIQLYLVAHGTTTFDELGNTQAEKKVLTNCQDGHFVNIANAGILGNAEIDQVGNIDNSITVTSLFGDSVLVSRVYRRCPLMIQGHVFFANLMELSFYGFDIILGMDWLTEHKAKIDFELKNVTSRTREGVKIVVGGE